MATPSPSLSPPPAYAELASIISRVQSRFIRAAPTTEVFEPLLAELLEFTCSTYGVLARAQAAPDAAHLRVLVATETVADAPQVPRRPCTRTETHELHDLDTLFGAAVTTGAPVLANRPAADARPSGLPPGHPPLRALLAVPLVHAGTIVGVLGLANRPGGYDLALVEFLEPLFASVGVIMGAVRTEEARRAAEQALRESEERLRTTFEMAAVGIAHLTPDGRFARANQHLCDMLGYDRGQLVALGVQDVALPEDLELNRDYARRLLRGEPPPVRPLEGRFRRRDGEIIWVSYRAALVRDDTGAPEHFIAVVEDITERRRTEAALLAAQAAERANAAKTEFLSRMSHELRTPLNAVLGFAQLLQMDTAHPMTDEQMTKLRHIEDAGAHLLAMINDVLDLSRIESGGIMLATETVSIAQLVGEARALVAPAARDAEVRVVVDPPAADGRADRVRADHLRLRQVLVNLLSNAIKYNRTHGRVDVRWREGPEGDTVQLQVRDTGQGMTPQQLGHLFEPFNRLGAERSRIEGTGIGLVVTQRLVLLMGGRIDAESEAGVGSTFTVTLPAAHGERREARVARTADAADRGDASRGPTRTVLYAEDNPMNVELVRDLMRLRPDCRLLVARNGSEAISLALREHPDLMLLDMHLGDMTGIDVMKRVGLDPSLERVPCVALSADAMPGPIEAARQAGFKGYLTKPLDVSAFLRCLDETFAGRSPLAEAR